MSVKSDKLFKKSKKIYLEWIEEKYNLTIKDIEHEFIQHKVLGNSVLSKKDAEIIGKKLGLFGRPYTSITKLSKEMGLSRTKASNLVNEIYLKISIKKELGKIK